MIDIGGDCVDDEGRPLSSTTEICWIEKQKLVWKQLTHSKSVNGALVMSIPDNKMVPGIWKEAKSR